MYVLSQEQESSRCNRMCEDELRVSCNSVPKRFIHEGDHASMDRDALDEFNKEMSKTPQRIIKTAMNNSLHRRLCMMAISCDTI